MFATTRTVATKKGATIPVFTPDFYAPFEGNANSTTFHTVVSETVGYSINSRVGNYAATFSGTSSGVRYAAKDTEFTFGTGDFSLTCWAFCTSTSGGSGYGRTLIDFRPLNSNGLYLLMGLNANGTVFFERNNSGVNSTLTVSTNAWHKFLLVRSSGVTSVYVDGDLYLTTPDTTAYAAGDLKIGLNAHAGTVPTVCWAGMVDDVKIYKGKVLPGAASKPVDPGKPAAPTPAFRLSFEDGFKTDQDRHQVLLSQNVQIINSTLPAGTSKVGKFTPTSSSATTSGLRYQQAVSEFTFGFAAFTVSFWINPSVRPAVGATSTILDMRPTGAEGAHLWVGMNEVGNVSIYRSNTTTAGNIPLPLNTWSYVVIVREAGMIQIFVNGERATRAADGFNYNSATLNVGLNAYYTTDGASRTLNGMLDEIKLYNGSAVYV